MTKLLTPLFLRLRQHQWAMVGLLATVAFILGITGLYRLKAQTGRADQLSWPDAIYFSLRLFGFNYDLGGEGSDPYATGNWQLWVARFLAPASTALAVAKAIAESVAERCDRLRISMWKRHAVVCGVGERGYHLALSLRKERNQVVVIDEKDDLEHLTLLRAQGILTIRGNAADPATLAAARIDRAAVIVALTPSVETNLEVVLAASQRQNGLPAKAFARAPRSFATMFEGQKPFTRDAKVLHAPRVECSFFDHNASAARVLVAEHVTDLGPQVLQESRAARILVAGDGDILPELLGVLIAQCQFTGPAIPSVTLLTADEDSIERGFPLHHPQIPLVVDLGIVPMRMSQMLHVDLGSSEAGRTWGAFDLVFVACREDGDTLSLATHLAQQEPFCPRVIAGLAPSTQLDQAFQRHFEKSQPVEGVVLYNLLSLGCEARHVVRQELDRKAQAIHAAYLEKRFADKARLGDTLAMHHWEDLRGDFRQANRSQADHIPIKKRILELSQSARTLELLAEAEHRRWMADRIVSGWRYAANRDDKKRLHPSIRPYAELSEADHEKDRDAVRTACSSE